MSRKRNWSLLVGVLSVVALACADVQAQGRRGGPGGGRGAGGFSVMQLLQMDEVREEIELTEDQVESIRKAAEEQRAGRGRGGRGERPNFRDMSEEEREKARVEMRERFEKEAKAAREALSEILLPHQTGRLDEIALQVQGVMALVNEAVVEKVGLTGENIESVKKAIEESQQGMREKMQELFAGGRPDREAMAEKFGEIRKEMSDQVLAVLSDEQREKFEELKGEPFELPRGAFFGRGGGRRGPDGGGPDGGGRRRGGEGGRNRPQRPADE